MPTTSSRMLSLLSLLQVPRAWTGPALADRLGVTPRTVRRDVDRLRDLGYAIRSTKGPVGGYRLEAGERMPPLLLDDEQALAVTVALRTTPSSGVAIEDASSRVLAAILQVMPSDLRQRASSLALEVVPAPVSADPAALEAVSAAVRRREVLRFDYPGSTWPRRTEPHGLVARQGLWYLIAWDLEREDWRTFRLDRMVPRTPTGPRFTPRELPAGDAATFLSAHLKGSREADRWPCEGTVEIDLPLRELAPWLPDARIEEVAEGRCRAVLGSWSWEGLIAQVIRLGAPFRLLGPGELVAAARTAQASLSRAADGMGGSAHGTR
ncbi:WYL domain-containing protein [Brachybacterium halotolerans subsp. kimchii]|uniref:helix-turn-helix transcriptional regulator n=1 Tax=Brachybacterium halotolerans TaxID=2795215 RepID=UPI001E625747|nr:WYL domain-containing protein [Brachybacterium halotolerans]UEJ81564.1 WYL domain-containing protein [Brachybacterium halotolerans subsp. kimchii]